MRAQVMHRDIFELFTGSQDIREKRQHQSRHMQQPLYTQMTRFRFMQQSPVVPIHILLKDTKALFFIES